MITKSIKWAVRASGHENKFELCNLCGTIPENHEDPANRESIWNPLIIVEITFNLIQHRIWKSWEGEIFKVQNKLENIQSMHDSSWSIMNFKVSNFQILRNLQIYIYRAYREARPKNHGSPNIELTLDPRIVEFERVWNFQRIFHLFHGRRVSIFAPRTMDRQISVELKWNIARWKLHVRLTLRVSEWSMIDGGPEIDHRS